MIGWAGDGYYPVSVGTFDLKILQPDRVLIIETLVDPKDASWSGCNARHYGWDGGLVLLEEELILSPCPYEE
jgi:hypothetical protein